MTPRTSRRPTASARLRATLSQWPAMPVTQLAQEADLSQPEATRTLQAMAEEGTLVRLRGGAYCLPEHAPREREPMPGLTPAQRRQEIIGWVAEDMVAPTLRDLAEVFGVSQQTVRADVRILVASGVLRIQPEMGARRNLALAEPWDAPWVDPFPDTDPADPA